MKYEGLFLSSLRPDNQIIMVFLILTFYLIFFAGFADIVDYLPIRYRQSWSLIGDRNGKDICRRYRIVANIVTANIGNIGVSAVSGTALSLENFSNYVTLHSRRSLENLVRVWVFSFSFQRLHACTRLCVFETEPARRISRSASTTCQTTDSFQFLLYSSCSFDII
jgi:hypothetical protein